jgi:two-component sensor histidine kinase
MNRERHSSIRPQAEAGLPSSPLRSHFAASTGKWRARLKLTAIILLVWTAVGMLQAVPGMFTGLNWHFFLSKVIEAWVWAIITPLVLFVDRKSSFRDRNIVRFVATLVVLSIPCTILYTLLSGVLLYPITDVWWSPFRNHDYAIYYLMGGWFTYCALVGVLEAFSYYNRFLSGQVRLERVERSLVEARLNALRLHLEPHFLFNALNAISSEVEERPELARNMIGDLGALLRRSLDTKDSVEITLAQELALLEHYLSIQRVRFGDRMEIRIDVQPDMLSVMVPSMLLQPLVENAIRHGIEGRISGGNIVVCGAKAGEQLQLRVIDDGAGLPRHWQLESSDGHGLRVTMERLHALYPEMGEQSLSIRRGEAGGTEVEIRIPLHAAGRYAAIA